MQVITEINKEWVKKHGEAWDSSDMVGIRYFLNQGGQIIGLDEKESVRGKNAVAPIIEGYIKELNKKGFNGDEIVGFTKQALDKASK